MPHSLTASLQASLLGTSFTQDFSVTGDVPVYPKPDVTPGKTGTLTARTDNDTGSATLETGHGILTADVVDVYWTDGVRRGMTVGTVATNVVPLDGGAGDNLPVLTTALVVKKQHEEAIAFAGDDLDAILLKSGSYRTTITFKDSGGVELLGVVLDPNSGYIWTTALEDLGFTNPLAGDDVATVTFSHESSADTVTMDSMLLWS